MERILVATDFSEDAGRALAYGKELARRFGAQILLVHVDELAEAVPGSPVATDSRREARRELTQRASELSDRELRVRPILRPGTPAEEILRLAETEGVGLIVMGTHGRTAMGTLLLGSVADRVVRRSAIPVLMVRHPDRATASPPRSQ